MQPSSCWYSLSASLYLHRCDWLLTDAGRAGKCPFGLLLQHHCPLPRFLSQPQGNNPCTLTPADLHNAPAQNSHEQQQQQQQQQRQQRQEQQQLPSTSQLGAAEHVISDATTELAPQDARIQSACHLSQQRTGCTLPCPEQSLLSPPQPAHGSDVMSTSSESSDCMAAAEPMTQDLVIADSEDEACMQPLQADSACFSGLTCDQTPPERLCLSLSPDALPELRQKAAASDGLLASAALSGVLEGAGTKPGLKPPMPASTAAAAAAAAQVLHQGGYDMPMHEISSGPWDTAIPASFEAPAVSSPPAEAASSSKADAVDGQGPCMPAPTASVRADASTLASHRPGNGDSPEDGNGGRPRDACIPAATKAVTVSAAEEVVAPISATTATCETMPAGPSHADPQVFSTNQLQQYLLGSHVPHSSITAFLWSAVRHIAPQVLHRHMHLPAALRDNPLLTSYAPTPTPCYALIQRPSCLHPLAALADMPGYPQKQQLSRLQTPAAHADTP